MSRQLSPRVRKALLIPSVVCGGVLTATSLGAVPALASPPPDAHSSPSGSSHVGLAPGQQPPPTAPIPSAPVVSAPVVSAPVAPTPVAPAAASGSAGSASSTSTSGVLSGSGSAGIPPSASPTSPAAIPSSPTAGTAAPGAGNPGAGLAPAGGAAPAASAVPGGVAPAASGPGGAQAIHAPGSGLGSGSPAVTTSGRATAPRPAAPRSSLAHPASPGQSAARAQRGAAGSLTTKGAAATVPDPAPVTTPGGLPRPVPAGAVSTNRGATNRGKAGSSGVTGSAAGAATSPGVSHGSTSRSSGVRRVTSAIASTLSAPVRQLPAAAVDIAPWLGLGLAAGLGSAAVGALRRRRRDSTRDSTADARLRDEIDAMRSLAHVR